jgi:hypothetical protein
MTDITSAESKVLAKLFDLDLFNDTSTIFGILPDALSQAYDERSYLGRISLFLFFNLKKE